MLRNTGAVSHGRKQESTVANSSPLLDTVCGIFQIIHYPATVEWNKLGDFLGLTPGHDGGLWVRSVNLMAPVSLSEVNAKHLSFEAGNIISG